MKSEQETESRSEMTRRVYIYITKEAVVHSKYVAARVLAVIIIVVVLVGAGSLDWKMLLNLLGPLVEWDSVARGLILFAKLLSCWMHPAGCARELIEGLDIP